jgi:DNA-binding transcriptional MerR regulator
MSGITLAELSEASGIPARTIRFYISRGLLKGPVKAGRGAVYSPEHLSRLEEIRTLQASGRMLSEISRDAGRAPEQTVPEPSAWWQYTIADDITVSVRGDASPWRTKQIRSALEELARRLRQPDGDKEI